MSALDVEKLLSAATAVPRLSTNQLLYGSDARNTALKAHLLDEPKDPKQLSGKKIAVLATDGVEEIEILGIIQFLKKRGASVDVCSPSKPDFPEWMGVQMPDQRETHILAARLMENAGWIKIDKIVDKVKESDYDAFVLPGGCWNPDHLRQDKTTLQLLKDVNEKKKTIAAICHAPLILASADLLKGRKATSYWAIMKDIENAGATVTDVEVVVDGNLITSRYPTDLPAFNEALAKALLESK